MKIKAFAATAALLLVAGLSLAAMGDSTVIATPLLVAQSATSATAVPVGAAYMSRCRETAVYIQWSAGTSAGVVTVESADNQNYAGTWASLGTKTWSAASSEDLVQITGIHGAIRTRISTTITGGTVSTFMLCN